MTGEWQQRRSLAENIQRALDRGAVDVAVDGSYTLPPSSPSGRFLQVKAPRDLGCDFSKDFLFQYAYARTTVPFGCRSCYKVKVLPRTLRELVGLRDLLETLEYHSKCGVDFYVPFSRDFYAGYLYFDGLDQAREAFRDMRGRVNADPELGGAVDMHIKRGCSTYEHVCGPSDSYAFADDLPEIEGELRSRFTRTPQCSDKYAVRRAKAMFAWIEFAFKIRDDTYLEFTGGKPFRRALVTFATETADCSEISRSRRCYT